MNEKITSQYLWEINAYIDDLCLSCGKGQDNGRRFTLHHAWLVRWYDSSHDRPSDTSKFHGDRSRVRKQPGSLALYELFGVVRACWKYLLGVSWSGSPLRSGALLLLSSSFMLFSSTHRWHSVISTPFISSWCLPDVSIHLQKQLEPTYSMHLFLQTNKQNI